jgi:DNA-binding FadR family transcriptional regulator
MWTPIPKPQSSVDACEQTIRQAILRETIPAGDRLPPERTLARELGVNRVTVRSALARLCVAGLIEIRQGSGARVLPWRESGGPDLLGSLASLDDPGVDPSAIATDLLAVRRHLAHAILEHLAASPSPIHLAPIEAAVDDFAKAMESGDTGALAAADLSIVRALLNATKSPVLQLVMNPIGEVVIHFDALRDALYRTPERNLLGWQGLLAWLHAPDAQTIPLLLAEMQRTDAETVHQLAGEEPQK